MNLRDVKLCIACDEVFDGESCPNCGETVFEWLVRWVRPLYKRLEDVKEFPRQDAIVFDFSKKSITGGY